MSKAAEKVFDDFSQDMAEAEESLQDSPNCSVDGGAGNGSIQRLEKKLEERDATDTCVDICCPNKHLGCHWSGNLTCVVEHTDYECDCSPVFSDETNVEVPLIIVMKDFEHSRVNHDSWYSPVFCTHEKGYQFRMRVDANGWCTGDSVAVVISLVKGDYDDQLQWPFEGVITVQLLNQVNNSPHSIAQDFTFSNGGYECQRVTDETQPEFGCWCNQFIMHKSLLYNSTQKSQYLEKDSLFFAVSYRPLDYV